MTLTITVMDLKGYTLMDYKCEFIEFMVESGVLTFGDFITKSGRRTPYFINTGNYKTGSQIAKLGDYYASRIVESGENFDAAFGPAYKGIPLTVAAVSSLYRIHGMDKPYCFNRKESKDHGEGGSIIGCKPKDGDRIAIIEDVVTAGTAVRESIAFFKTVADVKITALYVSVDRMERGAGKKSTLDELRENLGISVYPIVTVKEIISHLYKRPVNGKVYIDDEVRGRMEEYLRIYGAAEV